MVISFNILPGLGIFFLISSLSAVVSSEGELIVR